MIQALGSASSEYYSPSTKIILFTPPPIHEGLWLEFLESRDPPVEMDRSWARTRSYADAVKEIAVSLKVPVVDTWEVIWTAAGEKIEALPMFLSDGLHLTPEGYDVRCGLNGASTKLKFIISSSTLR